jgi:hypothetical protein
MKTTQCTVSKCNYSNLGINIKALCPNDAESRLLCQWLENGVFDALERRYVRVRPFQRPPNEFDDRKEQVPLIK